MVHPLASAVAIVALILPSTQSLSIKPSPPPQPPKALSSRSSSNVGGRSTTPVRTWNRPDRSVGGRGGSSRQQQPLRAYTVADNRKPSLSFWKLPPPFEKFASQFGSLEGKYVLISVCVYVTCCDSYSYFSLYFISLGCYRNRFKTRYSHLKGGEFPG
jgi:hypothetical protein